MSRAFGIAALAFLLVLGAAACGSGNGSSGAASTTTSTLLVTYGPQPTASARMICAAEGQSEIASSLGVKPSKPITPKWANHTYSCDYVYPNGVMPLSVHEAPSIAAARAYYDDLGRKLGRKSAGTTLGQGTFRTNNDSVVVIKDNKVLLVDVSHMPAKFGSPPLTRADTALSVAVTVLGCWTGA